MKAVKIKVTLAILLFTIAAEPLAAQRTYVSGAEFLNDSIRGLNRWGQGVNNDEGCNPAYNAYCLQEGGPIGLLDKCSCGRTPAGCAAVAMAQVMWYWRSPNIFNWNLIPNALWNTSSSAEADAVASLLSFCGLSAKMKYTCLGSFAFPGNVESALRGDAFNFKGARLVQKSDWSNSVWHDMIRAEIQCGRPVIYKGEKGLLNTDKHYFVIDGYRESDRTFHINFGWRNHFAWHALDNIVGSANGGYNYNARQEAIIGISPTHDIPHTPNRGDIPDVSYTSVTSSKMENAVHNITLPAMGKSLSVENGGKLSLVAGNEIVIRPGFYAKSGSQFTATIAPAYNMVISAVVYPNQGGMWLSVYNANSYDLAVWAPGGSMAFQRADTISGNRVELWDGAYAPPAWYTYMLRLRNNYGQLHELSGSILIANLNPTSMVALNDTINIEQYESLFHANDTTENEDSLSLEQLLPSAGVKMAARANTSETTPQEALPEKDFDFDISPNPNDGNFILTIDAKEVQPFVVEVFNSVGTLMSKKEYRDVHQVSISHSNLPLGIYFVKVAMGTNVLVRKIVVN